MDWTFIKEAGIATWGHPRIVVTKAPVIQVRIYLPLGRNLKQSTVNNAFKAIKKEAGDIEDALNEHGLKASWTDSNSHLDRDELYTYVDTQRVKDAFVEIMDALDLAGIRYTTSQKA